MLARRDQGEALANGKRVPLDRFDSHPVHQLVYQGFNQLGVNRADPLRESSSRRSS